MQAPNIKINIINQRAFNMIYNPLERKRIALRKKLLKEHSNDLYDYNDNQIENVLKTRFEEYYHLCLLLEDLSKTTII